MKKETLEMPDKRTLMLDTVKTVIRGNMWGFEMDFENKRYGKRAKLLHKHYKRILALLDKVE